MPILRLPKTVQWLFACSLLFLLGMGIYRWAVFTFLRGFDLDGQLLWPAYWTGFRLDARAVGFTTLFLLIISLIPGLHFFKTSAGKKLAIGLYLFFAACFFLFYMADLVYLMRFKTRLQAGLFFNWSNNATIREAFLKNTYWQILIPVCVLLVGLFYIIIRWLHSLIAKRRSQDLVIVRIYWQVMLIALSLLAIHGRLAKQPLTNSTKPSTLNEKGWQAALQPFQSVYDSWPGKQAKIEPEKK